MTTSSKTRMAAPVGLLTVQSTFMSLSPSGDEFMAVRPGLPAADALQHASEILSAVQATADHFAENNPDNPNAVWAVPYLVQMAKALIDSIDLSSQQEGGAA